MEDSQRKRPNITIDGMDRTVRGNSNEQTRKFGTVYSEKNYINVNLEKGETEKVIKIRLLPIDKNSDTPFKLIKMHTAKVPKEISSFGYKGYVCLKRNEDINHEVYGDKCPFCEERNKYYKLKTEAQTKEDKEMYEQLYKSMAAKDVCIIRCIERGHEEDGPKFWKFNVRQDKADPYNKILKLYQSRLEESIEDGDDPLNILDLYEGKDLKITITGEGKDRSYDIVDYGKVKPLAETDEEIDKLVNDEKVWTDVFGVKPYEYLKILLDGEVPFFKKSKKKWVVKGSEDDDEREADNVSASEIKDAEMKILSQASDAEEDDKEDLPF